MDPMRITLAGCSTVSPGAGEPGSPSVTTTSCWGVSDDAMYPLLTSCQCDSGHIALRVTGASGPVAGLGGPGGATWPGRYRPQRGPGRWLLPMSTPALVPPPGRP